MTGVDRGDFHFYDKFLYYVRRKHNEKAQEILKFLHDPVNKVDGLGNTLLHYVAQCTNDVMVKYLIELGAKIDVQNHEGHTPLWLAIDSYYNRFDWEECKRKSVLHLLNANANMHICDNKGISLLSHALATDGSSNVLICLFNKLNDECLGDSEKIAKKLIEANSSVYATLFLKNAEVTRILLNSGCPIEPPYSIGYVETTLQASICKNQLEVVRALLDHGADPNAETERHATPMITYSMNYSVVRIYHDKNPEILQLLLDRGANPTKILTQVADNTLRGKMQMYGVFRFCNRESIRVLLGSNVDFNTRDVDGYTAVHYAIQNERPNFWDEFKGRIFNASVRCRRGLTPLLYAVNYCGSKLSLDILKFLLRNDADPNAKDHQGMTALMYLCRSNFVDLHMSSMGRKHIKNVKRLVEYLLQNGADPQVVTPNGDTVFNDEQLSGRVYPVESVLAHLAMLKERGAPFETIICNQIDNNEKYKVTFLKYREQLQAMMMIKIWKSLTLRELLIGSEGKIKRYLREDRFTLKLSRLGNKYTIISYYHYAMRERVSRLLYLTRLKNKTAVIMTKIMGIDFKIYHIILDKIYSYLTEKDLLNLSQIL